MSKDYHHLTRDQRCHLYALKKRGDSAITIANELRVHRSTIYRELKRNLGKNGYRYKQANEKTLHRRHLASIRRPKMTLISISVIEEKLRFQWSPVQISGWLKKHGSAKTVSHETIYQHIWQNKRKGGLLYKELRHRSKKYNKRSKSTARRGFIPNRIDIDQRPIIVEKKIRLGDWELDTIVGTGQSGSIVSMVERTSKLVMLINVTKKTAHQVELALLERLKPIKKFCVYFYSRQWQGIRQ